MFGYTFYILLFIIAALRLISDSIPVIVGGVLFGSVAGTLISLVAATVASTLPFSLACWLGRDLLLKYIGHIATFQAIERGIVHSGVGFLILTWLAPLLPYDTQSYVYRLTVIPLWSSIVISALTTSPGIFIHTLIPHEFVSKGIILMFTGRPSVVGLALFALVQAAKAWTRYKHIDPSASHEYMGK